MGRKRTVNRLPTKEATTGIAMSDVKTDPAYDAQERRYRAERACEDLERAEKHKMNKELMKDVKGVIKEKMKAYGKI